MHVRYQTVKLVVREENDYEGSFDDFQDKQPPVHRMNLFGNKGIYHITSHLICYLLKKFNAVQTSLNKL